MQEQKFWSNSAVIIFFRFANPYIFPLNFFAHMRMFLLRCLEGTSYEATEKFFWMRGWNPEKSFSPISWMCSVHSPCIWVPRPETWPPGVLPGPPGPGALEGSGGAQGCRHRNHLPQGFFRHKGIIAIEFLFFFSLDFADNKHEKSNKSQGQTGKKYCRISYLNEKEAGGGCACPLILLLLHPMADWKWRSGPLSLSTFPNHTWAQSFPSCVLNCKSIFF